MVLFIHAIHAQSLNDDKQAISMIKECYVSYDSAWACIKDPVLLKSKLQLLQKRYCSAALQRKINGYYATYGLDHDVLMADMISDTSTFQSTLKVIKDTKGVNTYIVSFSADIDEPGVHTKRPISIRVGLIKENNQFKIDSVKED